jgi:acyl-CoA thioesterase FadM
MYPFLRFAKAVRQARTLPPIGMTDWHVTEHLCWPWDLDPFVELNNGRALTLYDLGRFPLGIRTRFYEVLRQKGWGLTVAGSTIRYRRRIRMFDRFTMRSRCIGWDARFFYFEQSMWKGDDCTSHVLIRMAMTGPSGILAPALAAEAMGVPVESPALPGWVQAWIAGDAQRPWPPER